MQENKRSNFTIFLFFSPFFLDKKICNFNLKSSSNSDGSSLTWDTGGSYRSSCRLWTTSLKSPAWKHTTSLVIRGRLFLRDCSQSNPDALEEPVAALTILMWTHHSPKCTAFSTPTAAVLCQSKLWPTWSAWALVRSSNRTSLGSLVLGRYWRFLISFIDL